jgi:hypothetical protein
MARHGPDKETCGAQRANQEPGVLCDNVAGEGTEHLGVGRCKFHGGSTPSHNQSAQVELARRACDRLGLRVEVSPIESLLDAVYEASGNVEYYRSLVAQLPSHPEDDEMVGFDKNDKPQYRHGDPGIYGKTYHVSGLPTGEAKKHILVQMYDDERDRLAKYRHDAISLGIESRRVQLEENRAAEVFRAVSEALALMGLEARFSEFREHFATAITNGRRSVLA